MQGELKPMEYESESEEEVEEELSTTGSATKQRFEKMYYNHNRQVLFCDWNFQLMVQDCVCRYRVPDIFLMQGINKEFQQVNVHCSAKSL